MSGETILQMAALVGVLGLGYLAIRLAERVLGEGAVLPVVGVLAALLLVIIPLLVGSPSEGVEFYFPLVLGVVILGIALYALYQDWRGRR